MSKPTGGGVNDVTRLLTSGVTAPGSPKTTISAASQADWAAKRLVWVPSEKNGFEVRRGLKEIEDIFFPKTKLIVESQGYRKYLFFFQPVFPFPTTLVLILW